MSLAEAVRTYNDTEQQQLDRLARIYEIMRQADQAVLVLSAEASEPSAVIVKSFNDHQLDQLLTRYDRTITFWSINAKTQTD